MHLTRTPVLIALLMCAAASAWGADGKKQVVVYALDFSERPDGPAKKWLLDAAFEFKSNFFLSNGFLDANKIKLSFNDGKLRFDTAKRAMGIALKEKELGPISTVRITWGVDKYPENAAYSKKINNEAVLVYVYFGKEKIPSGTIALPALPYFIGLYLGQGDTPGEHYKAKYYHRGGRFACIAGPKPGKMMVSEYDLTGNFKDQFKPDKVPTVSGFALEVDTTDSGDGGKASAFIRRIEFLKEAQ